MTKFNPNELGMANGNYFALPYTTEESEITLVSVPWDVTTSYRAGTHKGPEAIIDASVQVDLYDLNVPDAWEVKIGTLPVDESIKKLNKKFRKKAEEIIEQLEKGEEQESLSDLLSEVNSASEELNQKVYSSIKSIIESGKTPGIVGGDHSTPYGSMLALSEKYEDFGILHIDAHADLRNAYEGFTFSHASIMYNVLKEIPQVSKLCQVAIRDFCAEEHKIIINEQRVRSFTDFELRNAEFDGLSWNKVCDSIISALPDNVYISFDIDGLSPDLCPNTGTPVPGGLTFNKADHLLVKLMNSGKKIVGFDLVEVAPGEDNEWDANVGAKLLYKMCLYAARTCD